MRIYWLNGSVNLQPETEAERNCLNIGLQFLRRLAFTDGFEQVTARAFAKYSLDDQKPIIQTSKFGVQSFEQFQRSTLDATDDVAVGENAVSTKVG